MVAAAAAAAEQKPVTEWIEIIAPEESGGAPSPTAQRPGPSHRKRISQPRLPKDCALRAKREAAEAKRRAEDEACAQRQRDAAEARAVRVREGLAAYAAHDSQTPGRTEWRVEMEAMMECVSIDEYDDGCDGWRYTADIPVLRFPLREHTGQWKTFRWTETLTGGSEYTDGMEIQHSESYWSCCGEPEKDKSPKYCTQADVLRHSSGSTKYRVSATLGHRTRSWTNTEHHAYRYRPPWHAGYFGTVSKTPHPARGDVAEVETSRKDNRHGQIDALQHEFADDSSGVILEGQGETTEHHRGSNSGFSVS